MPPFQSEGPERKRALPLAAAPQRHVQPYGEEGEERDVKRPKREKNQSLKLKPFGDESSEDSESEPEFSRNGTSSTFALGWDTLANFNKATAWSKHDAQEDTNCGETILQQQEPCSSCCRKSKAAEEWNFFKKRGWLWTCWTVAAANLQMRLAQQWSQQYLSAYMVYRC